MSGHGADHLISPGLELQFDYPGLAGLQEVLLMFIVRLQRGDYEVVFHRSPIHQLKSHEPRFRFERARCKFKLAQDDTNHFAPDLSLEPAASVPPVRYHVMHTQQGASS